MYKLFSTLSLVLLYCTISFGQGAVTTELEVFDGIGTIDSLYAGLDLTATNGIDPSLGETDLPPFPPAGVFEARFDLTPYQSEVLSSYWDYRNAPTFPFTGVVEHTLIWQRTVGATTFGINYNIPSGATMTIVAAFGGLNSGPLTGIGTYEFDPLFVTAVSATLTFDYTNIGPPAVDPIFATDVASLDFGAVGVGLPSTLTVQVQNPGTAPLDIASAIPSDGQYTVVPNPPVAYPISIAIGGTYDFDVTFTPVGLGTQSATVDFTHNALTSPDLFPVTGVGADAGPTFGVSPTSLDYGVVLVGLTPMQTLTVINNGLSIQMNITSVTAPTGYTVTPLTAVIAPGATQDFDVTFTPLTDITYAGDITFVHDGTTSPDAVPVTGTGFVPAAISGLVFSVDSAFVPENTYDITATMQLMNLLTGSAVHALQFKLLSNVVDSSDNVILTFQSIEKSGSIANNPDWILETNVERGTINPNGASEDIIYCLLYNISDGALTGNWTNLMEVTYKTAVLPPLTPWQKSSFNIIDAAASNVLGNPVNITPSDPVLEVIVEAAGGTYGDVNGDGCVDILDLIMVVDHIVGRDSLTGDEFTRANLAPWPGTPEPTPDAFVNVQDLSVIQNIILTGFYPNGDPVTSCGYLAKGDGASDATVTIYINSEGISTFVDAEIGIRGAQIEFSSVSNNPENMIINTPLGQGYYLRVDELLRTLIYDRTGQKSIDAGVNNFMADMPFALNNPNDVWVAKIVLVDINTEKMSNILIQIIYGEPNLPLDYILFQNYPNPFNPTTEVRFQIPETSNVTLRIYDMLGQEVRTLFTGVTQRGTYTVQWDGLNNAGTKMSSGSYIYRMIAGDFVQSKKMILLK